MDITELKFAIAAIIEACDENNANVYQMLIDLYDKLDREGCI